MSVKWSGALYQIDCWCSNCQETTIHKINEYEDQRLVPDLQADLKIEKKKQIFYVECLDCGRTKKEEI
jgi:ribosomal protein L44E